MNLVDLKYSEDHTVEVRLIRWREDRKEFVPSTPWRVCYGINPVLSPNQRMVVYNRRITDRIIQPGRIDHFDNYPDIEWIDLRDNRRKILRTTPGYPILYWSPTSRHLILIDAGSREHPDRSMRIRAYDLERDREEPVALGVIAFHWSVKGDAIVFERQNEPGCFYLFRLGEAQPHRTDIRTVAHYLGAVYFPLRAFQKYIGLNPKLSPDFYRKYRVPYTISPDGEWAVLQKYGYLDMEPPDTVYREPAHFNIVNRYGFYHRFDNLDDFSFLGWSAESRVCFAYDSDLGDKSCIVALAVREKRLVRLPYRFDRVKEGEPSLPYFRG